MKFGEWLWKQHRPLASAAMLIALVALTFTAGASLATAAEDTSTPEAPTDAQPAPTLGADEFPEGQFILYWAVAFIGSIVALDVM